MFNIFYAMILFQDYVSHSDFTFVYYNNIYYSFNYCLRSILVWHYYNRLTFKHWLILVKNARPGTSKYISTDEHAYMPLRKKQRVLHNDVIIWTESGEENVLGLSLIWIVIKYFCFILLFDFSWYINKSHTYFMESKE